jgi:hypothetical protein
MKSRQHLVIPDCQVKPGVPLQHLEWAGKYIAEKRPDVIVCIGDFADMESLCSYDKGKRQFEGRRYEKDIEAAYRGMEFLTDPFTKLRGYKPKMVLTLGNHEQRIIRAVDNDATLEGWIGLSDLDYQHWGWNVKDFLEPVVIDGVHYSHYFPSGPKDLPCKTPRKILSEFHVSAVAGHTPGRDIAYAKRGDGGRLAAIIAGSFYQHDEKYASWYTNKCWRGLVVLHQVNDGQFDEMFVSLDYLKQKFRKSRKNVTRKKAA